MLSAAHTLISLPFGIYLEHPVFIFLAAFIGHLFADTLLHWNIFPFQFKRYPYILIFLDIALGLILSWMVLGEMFFTLPVWIAIAGGNAPDVLHQLWEKLSPKQQQRYFSWISPAFTFHDKLQLETPSVAWGLVSQAVLAAAAIAAIIYI